MKFAFIWIGLLFLHFALAQFPNVRISPDYFSDPEEVSIAINPLNPANLVAGANIAYYFFSDDSGHTWNAGMLNSSLGVWGDPCVRFDASGNAYFAHLSYPSNGYWLDRIVVQKSTDGGATWSNGAGVGLNPPKQQDKEWLAVDFTSSPYHNFIYMSWTEFDNYGSTSPQDSSRILFSRSTDGGTTWSNPIRISDHGGDCLDSDNTVEGAIPAVGPEGQIYVSWSGPLGIMFDRSLDGGVSFGQDIFVTDQPGGWDFPVAGLYRANGLPTTLCDISNSPYRGTIYIIWSDQRNGIGNTDVFLIKSLDGGNTWEGFTRVNGDSTQRDQFFPAATIDPKTGILYIVYYDRANTTGFDTEVTLARSQDGGQSFTYATISENPFQPNSSVFFGDYIDIAAYNGRIYPIWMRMDQGNLSVWTALINDALLQISSHNPPVISDFRLLPNFPNPFNSSTRIEYDLAHRTSIRLELFDVTGKKIRTLEAGVREAGKHTFRFQASGLAAGVYFYSLTAGKFRETRKMIYLP